MPPGIEKKKSSLDYPLLARKIVEASGESDSSKLPAGLYVVGTPIGHLGDISLRALVTLARVDRIACEDTRVSGGMLAKYGIKKPLLAYHDHNADKQRPVILKQLAAGGTVALISDAGMPLIADPGYKLVLACREAGHDVTVIPGANAALTALAGSGLPSHRFLFVGFLPPKKAARRKIIETLSNVPVTLLFYEAPQRLADTLKDFADIFGERPSAVARELTKLFEETRRGTLGELADFYSTRAVKGEVTLLVGGAEKTDAVALDDDTLLREHMENMSLRDAVTAVSTLTGVKKSEIYARALKLAKKSGASRK
ncbi:MAG: 16S rRNA (cytidine(1402)-2'-O)-methyltransferase [Alphaproteobacteria bacterium]|nr:16S rRNA (cytidine(1402)-2'-O)-methyltransferase [Alphaproteobacteria bacterium]